MLRFALSFLLVLLAVFSLQASQPLIDDPVNFKEHLQKNRYSIDTNAGAIVLYERAAYSLVPTRASTQIVTKVRRIIKILHTKGLKYADVMIPVHSPSEKYSFRKVVGKTYNLDNGELTVSEIGSKDVSTEEYYTATFLQKFSLRNVVVGSIIDYSYEIETGFLNRLAYWNFQEEIPKLYSEVNAVYPASFQVASMSRTAFPFKELKEGDADSLETDAFVRQLKASGKRYLSYAWVRKNIKAVVSEPFCYNPKNHTEKLELQVVAGQPLFQNRTNIYQWTFNISSWSGLNDELYSRIYGPLPSAPGFDLAQEEIREKERSKVILKRMKSLFPDNDGTLATAKRIFSFVRDSFEVREYSWAWDREDILDVLKNQNGYQSQVVMLLSRMFRLYGFKSNIVILGTRGKLRLDENIPFLENINYSVCRLEIGNIIYYLDPGAKYNPFGVLKPECYNGFAWGIDGEGYGITLDPATPTDRTMCLVSTEQANAANYTINIKKYFGDISGPYMRGQWRKDTTLIRQSVMEDISHFPIKGDLVHCEVDHLYDLDTTLVLNYSVRLKWPGEPGFLFVPAIYNYYRENPFKLSARSLPVELPFAIDINYGLSLTLPEGSKAENIPQSIVFKLDDENSYKYVVDYKEANHLLTAYTKLRMAKTYFDIADYDKLKTFLTRLLNNKEALASSNNNNA